MVTKSAFGIIPSFSGQSLAGLPISQRQLAGKLTVVIITPIRNSAEETSEWATLLRRQLGPHIRIRDILTFNSLSDFVSEGTAIERSQKRVPRRYWSQTWIITDGDLESELGTSSIGEKVFVYVIDSAGEIIVRVGGSPNDAKLSKIKNTLNASTAVSPQ